RKWIRARVCRCVSSVEQQEVLESRFAAAIQVAKEILINSSRPARLGEVVGDKLVVEIVEVNVAVEIEVAKRVGDAVVTDVLYGRRGYGAVGQKYLHFNI